MSVFMVVQILNVLREALREVQKLWPRRQESKIRRGCLIRMCLNDRKGTRQADLEIRIESSRVYRYEWRPVLLAVGL
jgi:hypothetical protein